MKPSLPSSITQNKAVSDLPMHFLLTWTPPVLANQAQALSSEIFKQFKIFTLFLKLGLNWCFNKKKTKHYNGVQFSGAGYRERGDPRPIEQMHTGKVTYALKTTSADIWRAHTFLIMQSQNLWLVLTRLGTQQWLERKNRRTEQSLSKMGQFYYFTFSSDFYHPNCDWFYATCQQCDVVVRKANIILGRI